MFKINFNIEKIGLYLVLTPLVAYVIDMLTLIVGGQISILNPLLTFGVVLLVMVYQKYKWELGHYIIFSCIFLWLATVLYDYGTDGQWYHAKIVQLLLTGGNPIFHPFDLAHALDVNVENEVFWAAHYAKGMEIVGATFAALTNNLETAKVINLYFIIGSFLLVLSWLKQYVRGWRLVLLVIVVTFNPIVVNQMLTGYIDWTAYTLLLITTHSLYQLLKGRNEYAMPYFLMLFFVLSIKFNIAFWIVIFTILFFCLLVVYKKCRFPKKIFLSSVGVLLLGLVVGGYNPYVTNLEKYGNPFYPLIGEKRIEIMDGNQLEAIKGKSRVEQVNISLVSNPNNGLDSNELNVFEIKKENVMSSFLVDTRLGGFGIFFFESCLLILIGFIFSKKGKGKRLVTAFCISLYVSLFLLPSGWWARYVSYFYLFPIVILCHNLIGSNKMRSMQLINYTAFCLLFLDIVLSFGGVCAMALVERTQVDYMLSILSNNQHNVIFTRNTLFADKAQKAGIKIEDSSQRMSCVDLLGKDVWVRKDIFESSKTVAKPFLLSKISMFDLKYKED